VYEFARCFRNEGMDPSHLPDFTMLEYYSSYWNYEDNMDFTEKMLKHLLGEVNGSLEVTYAARPFRSTELAAHIVPGSSRERLRYRYQYRFDQRASSRGD